MPSQLRLIALAFVCCLLLATAPSWAATPTPYLDLVPTGRLMTWVDSRQRTKESKQWASLSALPAGSRCIGIVWDEERDIREIRAKFDAEVAPAESAIDIQYWRSTWPPEPPKMPTIEDAADDPWQGIWRKGRTHRVDRDSAVTFTFEPLDEKENHGADNLPGVTYRRTLKVRLLLPEKPQRLTSLEIFSETTLEPLSIRIELGAGEKEPSVWNGSLEIFNGMIKSIAPWQFEKDDSFAAPGTWKNVTCNKPKGLTVDLLSAKPSPPGSNDITVVTIRGDARRKDHTSPRTVSFSTLDLHKGPIYVPDFHVYVTRTDDQQPFSIQRVHTGQTIRDRIALEPEQTYERAAREIPPLDPWNREGGEKVFLPVAADASWQKFAVEYGGNIFINKKGTKAMGAELQRLQWPGPDIHFQFGTGERPSYRENYKAQCSMAEDFLPIVLNRWEDKQFSYEEEAFGTLLEGPLDPNDPARNEQTPAVCMVQLRVTNKDTQLHRANVWLAIEPAEALELSGRRVMARWKKAPDPATPLLRAILTPPRGATMQPRASGAPRAAPHAILTQFDVPAGATEIFYTAIPFVSDISGAAADKLEALDYTPQRERVATYWRNLVNRTTRFTTPEPKFNALARSVVPHIHLSTTKDPKSKLYMVCAASYFYDLCANECCFQTQLLDTLGDTRRAGQYLKTLVDLQGSDPFPGNYLEPHDGVFHGAIVDKDYRYSSSNYALDHGTVLWTLARHYFSTRDAAWLRETLPHMLKAIAWIQRQRATMRQLDIYGKEPSEYALLPAGHLEDNEDWGYWFSVNVYCVAGMIDTAAAMKEIGDPRAQKIAEHATEYREALRKSVQRCTELAPVTRMRDGTYSPCVPTRTGQRFRRFGPLSVQYYSRYGKPDLPCYRLAAIREVLYGPMILLNLQVFDPDEPIANWILDDWEDNLTLSSSGGFNVHGFTDDKFWFSQGGMVFQANLQNPIWVYLNRQEAPAAIRGLYNAFVSCLYPDVNAFTEEYHEWTHTSGPFYKSPDEARFVNRLRDLLVLERGEDLWLAAGVPRRWLASRDGIQVDGLNTLFGPVSYTLRTGDERGTLIARITPPSRNRPKRVWLYLRLPDKKQPKSVRVGKADTEFDARLERVLLPNSDGPIDVEVRY